MLVQCVRDVYELPLNKGADTRSYGTIKGNLEKGNGLGEETIKSKEPSLSKSQVEHSLKTFRSTGVYLSLLKKGGLPEEFWHLYETKPTTTIEAVAMFPKPAQYLSFHSCMAKP
ncbi:hypothetical protein MTBBW1_2620011 [Desulfamplus magnetovallimortis]|uniref:Uncharacterized protein n=1 Tax=Desulfamplus magnetovallimortis TaxID=1246637 RepID=A0A1W1HEX8_9BACT|nr:hypothetical protein [Desulfamplus magnetovallimortis]SLM31047.1 hypothetical protein MTBBW1_2620011 [Desulfamplus magnetovallimortis]